MFFIWWSFRLTWAQGFQNCSYRHYFSGFCYPSLFINLLFLLSFQLYVLGFNIVYFYCTIISLHLSTHQNDYIFTILFNVFLFFSTFTLLKSLVRCSLRYNIYFFSKSKRREEKKISKILLILVFFPVDEKYKSSLSVPTCYVCHRRLSQCHLMSRENFLLIHKRKKKMYILSYVTTSGSFFVYCHVVIAAFFSPLYCNPLFK